MLFALMDYGQFRKVVGRYAQVQADVLPSFYYAREIPQERLNEVPEYAAILVGNYNTKLS